MGSEAPTRWASPGKCRSASGNGCSARANPGCRQDSLVEAVVQVLSAGIQPGLRGDLDEARQMQVFRLFGNVATGSPTLAGARLAEFARFTDEVDRSCHGRRSRARGRADFPTVLTAALPAIFQVDPPWGLVVAPAGAGRDG